MKIFFAYRFVGSRLKIKGGPGLERLKNKINSIYDILTSLGHEVFCSISRNDFYMKNNYSKKQMFKEILPNIDRIDAMFVLIDTKDKSEGMLMEIGYALAKNKPIILALKKGLHTVNLQQMVSKTIIFKDIDNLKIQLKNDII